MVAAIPLPGDLIMVRGKELHRERRSWARFATSWLIYKLTASPYTHCAVYAGGGLVIDVDLGQPVRSSPLAAMSHYDVFRKKNASRQDRHRAVYFCSMKRGMAYDDAAVLWIAAEKITGRRFTGAKNDPHRWFCSELAAAAWQIEHAGRITPADLARHADFEIVNVERPAVDALSV